MHRFTLLLTALVLLAGTGCQRAYYQTMEALGTPKRDLLVQRVEASRDSQEEAKEQFKDALEQFSALTEFEGGELEDSYRRLEEAFEESEAQAETVRRRIASVEDVAEALFDEWEDELDEYTDPELRRRSEQQLEETRTRYEQLVQTMHRAEEKMTPVIDAFRDQVLFLKHNLNARAIASLEGTVATLEDDIATLVAEMEASIEEADRFLSEMRTG